MTREELDQEFLDGYRDGRDAHSPRPNNNRSQAYRHSWNVGRAELMNRPIPADVSRRMVKVIELLELTP